MRVEKEAEARFWAANLADLVGQMTVSVASLMPDMHVMYSYTSSHGWFGAVSGANAGGSHYLAVHPRRQHGRHGRL